MTLVPYNKPLANLASSSRTEEYWPSVVLYVLPRPRASIPQYGPRARLVRGYHIRPAWQYSKTDSLFCTVRTCKELCTGGHIFLQPALYILHSFFGGHANFRREVVLRLAGWQVVQVMQNDLLSRVGLGNSDEKKII